MRTSRLDRGTQHSHTTTGGTFHGDKGESGEGTDITLGANFASLHASVKRVIKRNDKGQYAGVRMIYTRSDRSKEQSKTT